jgi:hypothetical protein
MKTDKAINPVNITFDGILGVTINWTAMITNLSMQRATLLIMNTQGLPENAVFISFEE